MQQTRATATQLALFCRTYWTLLYHPSRSEFFLIAYLAQMRGDGWTFFVATPAGRLPRASSDPLSFPPGSRFSLADAVAARGAGGLRQRGAAAARVAAQDDPELAAALAASLVGMDREPTLSAETRRSSGRPPGKEEEQLRAALVASMAGSQFVHARRSAAAGAVTAVASPSAAPPAAALQASRATLLAQLIAATPAEPPAGSPEVARLQLRMPPVSSSGGGGLSGLAAQRLGGSTRRFAASASLLQVFNWAHSTWLQSADTMPPLSSFELLVGGMPPRVLSQQDVLSGATLAAVGLCPSATLVLRPS